MLKSRFSTYWIVLVIATVIAIPTGHAGASSAQEKPAAHAAEPAAHASAAAAPSHAPAQTKTEHQPAPTKEPPATSKEPTAHGAGLSTATTAEQALQLMKQGNARFVAGKLNNPNTHSGRRSETAAKGQKPFVSIVSCSDSRVPVELVFDRGVGELFVIRVAGNVCNTDEIGSAEYGVGHLGTPLLLVIGHTKCGAVTAVATGAQLHGHISSLVETIKPAVAEARKAHPDLAGEAIVPQAIRANIFHSIEELLTRSSEIAELVEKGKVRVEGALYDIAEGNVEWLGPHPRQDELLQHPRGESTIGHTASAASRPSNLHTAAEPAHTASSAVPAIAATPIALTWAANSVSQASQIQSSPGEQVAGFKPSLPPGLLERCMAEESYRQGAKHLQAGEYDQAAEKLEAASQMDPTLLVAKNDLAGVCYLKQRYSEAVALYTSVLAVDPHYPHALRGAALCYASLREYKRSREMLESLLSLDRDDARTWLDLGDVHFLSGDGDAAQQCWRSAAEAKTADAETARQLGLRLKSHPSKSPSGHRSPAATATTHPS